MVDEPSVRNVFPVQQENMPAKRRAVFSHSFAGLGSHHAPAQGSIGVARPHRRRIDDDSLRLIDDLTNRPMDMLYTDARLLQRPVSPVSLWATRIIVFLICIAVGWAGSLFVRQLSTDPRREVREQLVSQLEGEVSQAQTLTETVNGLRSDVETRSKNLSDSFDSAALTADEMANGQLPVEGPGIVLTVADPLSAAIEGTNGSSSSNEIRVVKDTDLQMLVSLLWRSGAEAISVNGYRLGVQTSIRTAGSSILVGVNAIQSPYRIEAIGDQNMLAAQMDEDSLPDLYASFSEAGIYPRIAKSNSITLEAAVLGNISYATREGE